LLSIHTADVAQPPSRVSSVPMSARSSWSD